MATDKSFMLASKVNTLSDGVNNVVVPDGKTWVVREFIGDCSDLSTTCVLLIWKYDQDEANWEYMYVCNGQSRIVFDCEVTGDGTSELAILLRNESASSEYMMGIARVWEL